MARRSCWSHSEGAHGRTVTVYERRPGGRLSLRWWDPGVKNWRHRSLGHADRALGEQQCRALAGQLLAAGLAPARGILPLVELFGRYEREVSVHKKGRQVAEDRRRMELWQMVLGAARDVRTLDVATLNAFVRDRRAGRIELPPIARNKNGIKMPLLSGRNSPPRRRLGAEVSDTTIGADIVFLQAVFNWATLVRLQDGSRLLEQNPIKGYERPQTRHPRRPVATYDRFLALRPVADQVDPQRLFGAFLDLVEALGWRVSALCQLWASDFDRRKTKAAPFGRLRKRGAVDKEGVEMWVPLPAAARAALDLALERHPALGDRPIFSAPRDPERAWTRWHARDLLERAEASAGIEPLAGSDFHAYRRKWATERKHLPDVDVAAAGGWRDPRSLKTAYQQVDDETLLAVVSEPRKLREAR